MSKTKVRRRPAQRFRSKGKGKQRKVIPITSALIRLRRPRATLSAEQYAAIMDVSRYLSGYLSGEPDVQVYHDPAHPDDYSCVRIDKPKKASIIYLPDWREYDLPIEDDQKWRIYRGGLWHETQHIKWSPIELWSYYVNEPLKQDVGNIIEDRRVEDLGLDWHRAHLPELLYNHAYGISLRDSVSDLWKQYEQAEEIYEKAVEKAKRTTIDPQLLQKVKTSVEKYRSEAIHEAFLQKTITGRQKGTLPPKEQAKVDRVVEYVVKELQKPELKDLKNMAYLDRLVRYAIKELGFKYYGGRPSWTTTFSESFAEQQRGSGRQKQSKGEQQKKVKADVQKFLVREQKTAQDKEKKEKEAEGRGKAKGKPKPEPSKPEDKQPKVGDYDADDVKKAMKGDKHIADEFSQIRKGDILRPPGCLSREWEPVGEVMPTSPYADSAFKRDMKKKLKEWEVGKSLHIAKRGTMVDVSAYIATGGKKPFRKIERKSVKGQKYLFLFDLSGSIKLRAREYKKALINTLETLDAIHAKTAVFAFTADRQKRIKLFEKRRWTKTDSGRLASLEAAGFTPMAPAYENLRTYVQKHRPDIMITVTDGAPDNWEATQKEITFLKKRTRMVAFGVGTSMTATSTQNIRRMLKDLGYHDSFAVDRVNELPPKIVDLIAPVAR